VAHVISSLRSLSKKLHPVHRSEAEEEEEEIGKEKRGIHTADSQIEESRRASLICKRKEGRVRE
jgi:hypothetical protein